MKGSSAVLLTISESVNECDADPSRLGGTVPSPLKEKKLSSLLVEIFIRPATRGKDIFMAGLSVTSINTQKVVLYKQQQH